jgi:hypothetical protein
VVVAGAAGAAIVRRCHLICTLSNLPTKGALPL